MLVTLLYRDLDIGIGVIGRLKKKKTLTYYLEPDKISKSFNFMDLLQHGINLF